MFLKQNNALSELIASSNYILCLNTGHQLGKEKNLCIVFLEKEKERGQTTRFCWTYSKVDDIVIRTFKSCTDSNRNS